MTADLHAAATGLIERWAAEYKSGVPEDAGDDGLFGPASVTWRVSADQATPVAGLRSLLMQALLDSLGLDAAAAGFWRDVRDGAIAVLPEWAREMHGYGAPPPLTPGRRVEIGQSLGVLDAGVVGETGVLEARQRTTLRMRAVRSA